MTLEPGIYSGAYVRPERYEREPHTPTVYEYYAADTITGELISELPLVSVSYSRGVSKAGELSGQIPVNQIAGLDIYTSTQPIKTSLFAIKNGQVMWGGIIWSRTYSPVSQQVSITCNTFESYLFKRHIYHTLLYPNTVDQYEVVRQLIDEMQTDFNEFDTSADHVVNVIGAASIGITYETRIAGQHQDTQTWDGGEMRSFGDAITEFANNLNGFEWNIKCSFDELSQTFIKKLFFRDTPPGQIPLGDTYTGVRTGLDTNILEYPGNISDISLDESGEATSTRFITVGGFPDGSAFTYKPRGSYNNMDYLNDGWPLVEIIDSSNHPSAYAQETLDDYSLIGSRHTRPVVPTWTVTTNAQLDPQLGSYELGDWCQLVVEDDFIASRLAMTGEELIKRIMGYSVNVPDVPQEPETVSLELEDEWIEGA
jgi:hypothetical protein